MGYSKLVIRRMLAYVPRKSGKTYVCIACGARGSMQAMANHLTQGHGKKIEGAGYVFYEAEPEKSDVQSPAPVI